MEWKLKLKETRMIRISRQPIPLQIMAEENPRMWNISNIRGSVITKDARRKSRIQLAKAAL
jgi:hypothetical protein